MIIVLQCRYRTVLHLLELLLQSVVILLLDGVVDLLGVNGLAGAALHPLQIAQPSQETAR